MKLMLDTFKQARSKSNIWMIPVFEGKLTSVAKDLDFDARQARAWGFTGRSGQQVTVALNRSNHHALLTGAGPVRDFTAETARQVIGRALRQASFPPSKKTAVLFVATPWAGARIAPEVLAEALAEGATLAGYAFTLLKRRGTSAHTLPVTPNRLLIAMQRVRAIDRRRFQEGLVMARWTNWGRDLLNQSQSHVTAAKLASAARSAARKLRGVRCTVWGPQQISKAKLGLLQAVNQGSSEPARFVILQHNGGRPAAPPVCLVGKGLTYDTGGYNLKPGDSMRGMHMDKGGAIGVLASFFAAVELKTKTNLVCLVPATDNRVSATAMVPGDVFISANGISVEVDNTDAEGRLVLADALAYAKKFKPSHIIDMATLTGAAVVALGDQASAMFCADDTLARQLSDSASDAGELLWRLPLWDAYNDKLKSKTADIKNVGDRWGGAITAALFLKRFVPDGTKWCHLDIAGKMSSSNGDPTTPAGSAYGFGPRLIGRWLRDHR